MTVSHEAVSYDELPLVPIAVADQVCRTPYTARELSGQIRPDASATEAKRRKMTPSGISAFCQLVDERCRAAYAARAGWFMRCARARGNRGRDQLYSWVQHWLAAFLLNQGCSDGGKQIF